VDKRNNLLLVGIAVAVAAAVGMLVGAAQLDKGSIWAMPLLAGGIIAIVVACLCLVLYVRSGEVAVLVAPYEQRKVLRAHLQPLAESQFSVSVGLDRNTVVLNVKNDGPTADFEAELGLIRAREETSCAAEGRVGRRGNGEVVNAAQVVSSRSLTVDFRTS